MPEVRAAAPVIEATVATDKSNLLILGVDMLGDRSIRNYDLEENDEAIDDPLIFLAQPDSLMVTKKFADERGLAVNSKLPMRTMQGDQVFTVRGIMKPGGLANAFGGDLAIMDIYAAQKMFGRGTQVRSDRYRTSGRHRSGRRDRKIAGACSAPVFRWNRLARAGNSSNRRRECTRWRRTSLAYSRCSLGCSSSTTPSRSQ